MVQAVKTSAPLRIGVIGVGTMGSNHARVLAGLSGVQLVGVADPDRAPARPRHARARLSGGRRPRGAARARRRCGHDRGADASASRHRAGLHRARHPRAGREADRVVGRGGPRHHRRRAQGRRHADGRPRRALQSGGDRRSRRRSAARTFFPSRSPASVRSRRACRMSAW